MSWLLLWLFSFWKIVGFSDYDGNVFLTFEFRSAHRSRWIKTNKTGRKAHTHITKCICCMWLVKWNTFDVLHLNLVFVLFFNVKKLESRKTKFSVQFYSLLSSGFNKPQQNYYWTRDTKICKSSLFLFDPKQKLFFIFINWMWDDRSNGKCEQLNEKRSLKRQAVVYRL